MSRISDELKKLVDLQKIDLEIDALQEKISAVPVEIEKIMALIQAQKNELEQQKKQLKELQVGQNSKNTDLETIEQTIKKHTTELNLVKSNQAYRALLDEIEEAKKQKSTAEDSLLQYLEEIDNLSKMITEKQLELKNSENKAQRDIQLLQESGIGMEKCRAEKTSQRAERSGEIEKKFLDTYEYLRNKKKPAVVPVEGKGCGGCHMQLCVDNLNQLY